MVREKGVGVGVGGKSVHSTAFLGQKKGVGWRGEYIIVYKYITASFVQSHSSGAV